MSRQPPKAGTPEEHLVASFEHALGELEPAHLVRPHLPSEPPELVVAVGKAALPMLKAAREAYPGSAWIATPPVEQVQGMGDLAPDFGENGLLLPGSHPSPDERSVKAGAAVLERVAALNEGARLLLLLSGGGSSLLAAPAGVTLAEKKRVAEDLMRAGANIHQLNTVRKHLSRIKGGRLAASTRAAILNLVISDVPGDDLATVASGPAAPDDTTYADALSVLNEFDVPAPAVRRHLERGMRGEVPEGPGSEHPVWRRVESRVVGSNALLLDAAKEYWERAGYRVAVLSDLFQDEARWVARAHADVVEDLRREGSSRLPLVLLSGGEATVKVEGSGRGGRNQEFALWLLKYLGPKGVWAISAGSDGIDGNSPAAGAVLRPDSWERAERLGLGVDEYLRRNDSYSFFHTLGDSVVTGLTGNNVNDYRAIVVDR